MPLVHFHLADSPIICGDHCPVLDVDTIYVKESKHIGSEYWRGSSYRRAIACHLKNLNDYLKPIVP